MEKLLALADELGRAIAAHERFQGLRVAEKRVNEDKTAEAAQHALENQMNHMAELEQAGKPIEVSDKRKIEQLQNEFRSHPLLQQLVKAQADYLELMNKINQTIVNRLRPGENNPKQ